MLLFCRSFGLQSPTVLCLTAWCQSPTLFINCLSLLFCPFFVFVRERQRFPVFSERASTLAASLDTVACCIDCVHPELSWAWFKHSNVSGSSWFCCRSLGEQEQDHVKTAGLLVQMDLDMLSSWFCLSSFSFAHDQKQQLLCKLAQLLATSSKFSLPVYVHMCSKYENAYTNSISLCSINILHRTPWIASLLSPSLVSSLTVQILYTSESCFISEDKCSDSATKNALSLEKYLKFS